MGHPKPSRLQLIAPAVALLLAISHSNAQSSSEDAYRTVPGWGHLPGGRSMGILSGAFPDTDGQHLWILERCGADECAGTGLDPIHKMNLDGNVVASFGRGLFAWPHGFFLDHEGYLWVTEGAPHGDPRGQRGEAMGLGHQVHKLNQDGQIVMSLGQAGVPGHGPEHFNGPAGVVIGTNGDIWVADGHRGGNNRIVKFSRDGQFLLEVGGGLGTESREPMGFDDVHDIKMDSQGRVFVADRGNSRIQVFDSDGNLLEIWTQFGKPSGLFIDRNDTLYVADGLSGVERPGFRSNIGWERGIRIGDARTGRVRAFIRDTTGVAGAGIEFLGVDFDDNIYAGFVGSRELVKYERVDGASPGPVEALTQANALARLAERRSGAISATATAPSFIVDPGWPKPLPDNWLIGQVGGIHVDHRDQVWVYHRPRSLELSEAGALGVAGTDEREAPVSGLGHPRMWGQQRSGCCVPAPSVLKFDLDGNLLDAWGGPSDPGFLEERCREQDGCYWPAREHGIFVDHNDFVYVSGNGEGFTGQFPWAASFGNDSHVLKFTADGQFVYQIGHAGRSAPDDEAIDGGPNGTPQPYLPADMSVDPRTNRLYIADGYGNRRILIVDAETGRYVGHFGAYGQNPVHTAGTGTDPYDAGAWMADYHSGQMKPPFFRGPLHCAKLAADGRLYACDRGNNRIQVFDAAEVGGPCSNPEGEIGKCGFLGEVYVAPQTDSGTSGSAAFSTDAEQSCLYVGDLANNTVWVLNRDNLHELGRIGRGGRQIGEFHWIHDLAVDSQGNIYTGEVDSGKRVQRFLRYGEARGCAGPGNPHVGQ